MIAHSRSARVWIVVASAIGVLIAGPAFAQDDDDAKLRPAEPDYAVINLPTTLPLPVHGSTFRLTHRFLGNLADQSFSEAASNLFGLDQGAAIGLEYRFGVMKHLEAGIYRTSFDKTIQFFGKYDGMHQDEKHPVGVSAIVAVEGTDNFQEHYVPSFGATVSYTLHNERLALYGVPMWSHNTAAALGQDRDTFFLGMAGRVRILGSTYVSAEVTPRLAGYGPGNAEYGFSIEKRVGGHFFSLTFTNSFTTTYGQLARGGLPDSLYLGFNLARKFF